MKYLRMPFWGATFGVLFILGASVQAESKGASLDLDPRVQIALGHEGEGDFRTRLRAVHNLPKQLSQADAEALFSAIVAPSQAEGLDGEEWAALYNDVLNLLSGLEEPLPYYTKRLFKQLGELDRDEVLRDYALQHLLSYIEYRLEPAQREELLEETAAVALAATDTTLPGTYLLGVYRMADKPSYPSKDIIAQVALSIASDLEAFGLNRITAIQICAQLDYKEALPLATEIASDDSLRLGLRTAAISAIGLLGSEEDRQFLVNIKRWGHPRLQYAANSALQNI